MSESRPPGKEELAPVPEEERFRRLEELEKEEPPGPPLNEERAED